jgi:xanthine dehydrogenase accessory factor
MKEINEIIKAYKTAQSLGLKTALATVVKVDGSSYRQPGARMLVTEKGNITGAISGGCLEGDALRKALLTIQQQQNKLITYDTNQPDDEEFGLQLGCNGVVHILFEFIDPEQAHNPITLLEKAIHNRKETLVITVFSLNKAQHQLGTIAIVRESIFHSANTYNTYKHKLMPIVSIAVKEKKTIITELKNELSNEYVILQYLPVPLSLVIVGAGNDAMPVVAAADIVGWHITVVDGRSSHAQAHRFPKAHEVLVANPQELIKTIKIDEASYFVLMTHNYNYDLALLKLLLNQPVAYIGMLGPKAKFNRMISDLLVEGIEIAANKMATIFSPVGLDIGGETAEEIALSIIAEIKAVSSNRNGGILRSTNKKIHDPIMYL